MFYTVHRRVVFVESFFLFQIMWGFSKGCQGQQQQPEEQKNTKESKRWRRRRRLRQGLSATDVKKIVSEVQKIGLLGVAMWNLNSHCAGAVNIAPQDSSDQPLESSYFAALSQHVWGETRK